MSDNEGESSNEAKFTQNGGFYFLSSLENPLLAT